MTHARPVRLSLRFLTSLLLLSLASAVLAPAVAAPANASEQLVMAQSNDCLVNGPEWHIEDDPALHGGWQTGEYPESYGYGYGRNRYKWLNPITRELLVSNYVYAHRGSGHWAQWDMKAREGTQEIAVFIPHRQATARVKYRINVGSSSIDTEWITQRYIYGWHCLETTINANNNRISIEVHFDSALRAPGARSRIVGVDAVAMRCVSNCSQGAPSAPQDVRVITSDGTLEVTWTAPARSGSRPISHYHIRYYRETASGEIAWSYADEVPASDRSHVNTLVASGRSYDIELTAVNGDGRRSPTVKMYAAAIGIPDVTVEPEGRPWYWPPDDPDAVIYWNSILHARAYDIDWRYMRIDTERLRQIYFALEGDSLSEDARDRLTREAATILEGTEIDSSELGGDSRTAPGGQIEVICYTSDLRLCTNLVTGRTDNFNENEPQYRIHSDQQDKVLQVRVRAIGSLNATASWSEWAYHPASRFNVGCTFLDVYNTIKNVHTAIDVASVILTVGGVVAAVFTGGTSIAATQGTRAALVFAAKEIIRLIIKHLTLKRFITGLIKELAKNVVLESTLELAGFTFGCLVHGADLSENDAKALGRTFIEELAASGLEAFDVKKALENWDLVDIK